MKPRNEEEWNEFWKKLEQIVKLHRKKMFDEYGFEYIGFEGEFK